MSSKKVCNKLAGSALLKDEDLVARILDAVVAAVDVPVTLKPVWAISTVMKIFCELQNVLKTRGLQRWHYMAVLVKICTSIRHVTLNQGSERDAEYSRDCERRY